MIDRKCNILESNSFFLFGARGTGKSTLLRKMFEGQENILWIDLLDPAEEDLFVREPNELTNRISGVPKLEWVIIDEVQKAPSLLNLVHQNIESANLKFGLTGSSARRLKQRGVNLLAGRAFTNHLFPFWFMELGSKFNLCSIHL